MSNTTNKDIRIAPGAVVCVESKLRGSICIGSMTVIHPKATIIADKGPIIIGENNIIEEKAFISHQNLPEATIDNPIPLMIGMNNIFEVGCTVMAKAIGDHNVLEAKCYVGPEVELGNGCIVGAGCRVTLPQKIEDNAVISGSDCVRTIASDKPPAQTLQIDFLTKVLPNYHHLRKTKKIKLEPDMIGN
uniref:Dynactin subunit 6 n=1 Tax=Clastoptera arizonana TaxID=38151 RepID=A0A1B6E4V0_9HEMI